MSLINKARTGGRWKVALALAGVAAAALTVSACGVSSSSGTSSTSTSSGSHGASTAAAAVWSAPNADLQNTRAIDSSITSANVSKLRVAWRIPLKHAGVSVTTPTLPWSVRTGRSTSRTSATTCLPRTASVDLGPAERRVGARTRCEDGQGALEVPGDEEPRRAVSRRHARHGRGLERPRDRA